MQRVNKDARRSWLTFFRDVMLASDSIEGCTGKADKRQGHQNRKQRKFRGHRDGEKIDECRNEFGFEVGNVESKALLTEVLLNLEKAKFYSCTATVNALYSLLRHNELV